MCQPKYKKCEPRKELIIAVDLHQAHKKILTNIWENLILIKISHQTSPFSTYHGIVELIGTEGGNTRFDASRPERYQRQPDKRDKPAKQQPFKGFMVYSHLRLVEI